jgi:predicted AAA+ superfamily ATPase
MKEQFINRALSSTISRVAESFPVITVTGPRQSGKTTLIKHAFKQLPYRSLENPNTFEMAMGDPVAFLNQHPEGMILDEVQNTPQLLSYIQGIVDDDRSKRFILSGSSQFSMLKQVTQSLAGRTAVLDLLPFSYSEVRPMAEKKSLDQLLFDGFYPAIYADRGLAVDLYPGYVRSYLERDVRDLFQVREMLEFQTFMRLCAARAGNLFNLSELSNEVGVSLKTIKSWLSVLQASYIIMLLPPWFENVSKRLTKTPKLYFIDTGLACSLLGIESAEQLARDRKRGDLFENFIVMECLKRRFNEGKMSNLFFYRDSNHNEVDLLLRNGDRFEAIEIKSSQTYISDFDKGLKVLDKTFPGRVESKTVVYAGTLEGKPNGVKVVNYKNFM